jgi:hypothetical protein
MSDEKNAAQAQLAVAAERCPVGLYSHYKTDDVYIVYGHSVDEATLAPLVHYYSVSRGSRWTRTIANFIEIVHVTVTYPGPPETGAVSTTTRFVRTGDVTEEMLARARGDRGAE